MAAIDKIYMTEEQGRVFWEWIYDHEDACQKQTSGSLITGFHRTENGRVVNYPERVDWYLWHHCKLKFVRERLAEQYSTPPCNDFTKLVSDLLALGVGTELLNRIEKFDSWALWSKLRDRHVDKTPEE